MMTFWCAKNGVIRLFQNLQSHQVYLPVPVAAWFATARLLRMWVRVPSGKWMSLCCECCVLSGRGLCVELITRPEESYLLRCFVECDLETSWMRRPWPTGGCCDKSKKIRCIRTSASVAGDKPWQLLHPRQVQYISLIGDNSITTQHCHNTIVSQHNTVTTQQCHNTTVSQHNSVTTQQCHNTKFVIF